MAPSPSPATEFFLVRGSSMIPLTITTKAGGSTVWQAALRPREPLPVGSGPYTLLAQAPSNTVAGRQSRIGNQEWSVGPLDTDAPQWAERPRVLSAKASDHGWGPELDVKLLASATELIVLLADIRPNDNLILGRFQLFLIVHSNLAHVFSGPCGGNFEFLPRRTYYASLTALDAAGNQITGSNARITLERPTK